MSNSMLMLNCVVSRKLLIDYCLHIYYYQLDQLVMSARKSLVNFLQVEVVISFGSTLY